MIGVYTYAQTDEKIENSGFNSANDMAAFMALSIEYSRKQFSKIVLVANRYAIETLINDFELPFDEVVEIPDDEFKSLNPELWAYWKIWAYNYFSERKIPFVHIDNDVIIWDKISPEILGSDLFFQNKESFDLHKGYKPMLNRYAKCPIHRKFKTVPQFGLNCGIVGVNNFEIVKEWFRIVNLFIFSVDNKDWWNESVDKHSLNHLFEQYFISALISDNNVNAEVLIPNFYYGIKSIEMPIKLTHLWGSAKRGEGYLIKVRKRLYNEFPKYRYIDEIKTSHRDVFTHIYKTNHWEHGSGGGSLPERTVEYRNYIENFLTEKQIKSVVDLGCGDFQFSKLILWGNTKYTGIDVVESLMKKNNDKFSTKNVKFIAGDVLNCDIPECDLLIIKDVFIHWTNDEIKSFFSRSIKAKYILVTNDPTDSNKDIPMPGKFREVDITKPPFNIKAKLVLNWTKIKKHTYLIENQQQL